MIRIYSALKLDNGTVICQIDDVETIAEGPTLFAYGENPSAWAAVSYDLDGPFKSDPNGRDPDMRKRHTSKTCGPEQPCGQCHQDAQEWWPESQKRLAEALAEAHAT